MAKVPNAIEILLKIWTAWVGRTNVTEDRRQTDRRATAYSEPFAKNGFDSRADEVRSIAMFESVCLSLCLCMSARIFQKDMSKLHETFGTCYPRPWFGPFGCWQCNKLRTCSSVDHVMSSHNCANTDTGHWRIIHRDLPGGAGGKVCSQWLLYVLFVSGFYVFNVFYFGNVFMLIKRQTGI